MFAIYTIFQADLSHDLPLCEALRPLKGHNSQIADLCHLCPLILCCKPTPFNKRALKLGSQKAIGLFLSKMVQVKMVDYKSKFLYCRVSCAGIILDEILDTFQMKHFEEKTYLTLGKWASIGTHNRTRDSRQLICVSSLSLFLSLLCNI